MKYQNFCKYTLAALMICCFCARGAIKETDVMIMKSSDSSQNIKITGQQFCGFIEGKEGFQGENSFLQQIKKYNLEKLAMLSCGACIPDNADIGTLHPLLIAGKEKWKKGIRVIDNNPNEHETDNGSYVEKNVARLLYCDKFSHTERQLAITLLKSLIRQYFHNINNKNNINVDLLNSLLNLLNVKNEVSSDGSRFLEQISNQQLELLRQVKGDLLVYTDAAPCGVPLDCNCDFSCIEYYQQLAKLTPNVRYYVCFPLETTVLDPDFAIFQKNNGNYGPLSALHKFLTDNLTQPNNNFKKLDNYLKQLNNNFKSSNINYSIIKDLTEQAREILISKNNVPDLNEEMKEEKKKIEFLRQFYNLPSNVDIKFLDCNTIRNQIKKDKATPSN